MKVVSGIAALLLCIGHKYYQTPLKNAELDALSHIVNIICYLTALVLVVNLFSMFFLLDENQKLFSERSQLRLTVLSGLLVFPAIALYSRKLTGASILAHELTVKFINQFQFLFLVIPFLFFCLRIYGFEFAYEPIDERFKNLGIWLSGKPVVQRLVQFKEAHDLSFKMLLGSIISGIFWLQLALEGSTNWE